MAQYSIKLYKIVDLNTPHALFNFTYPIHDEKYREVLERNIIEFYYHYEIGFETIFEFKMALKNKMNLIMPYYKKMYESDLLEQRILDNYDVTEIFEKTGDGKTIYNNKVLSNDTPMGKHDIDSVDFVSNIDKTNSDTLNQNKENWKRTMKGNIGVQNDSDAINKYRTSLIKIDEMVINELRDLFMMIF